MNQFTNTLHNITTHTTNGMVAQQATGDSVVDLFYNAGALRGKDIIPYFMAAYGQNKEDALRTILWARDVREGAGERQHFRNVMLKLFEIGDTESGIALLMKAPELGRWDDVICVVEKAIGRPDQGPQSEPIVLGAKVAVSMISDALRDGDGLCAKWMPREGTSKHKVALALHKLLGMSPKFYRKTLVRLTKVVETQMCAKEWDEINFSHVPSVASGRYMKAFKKNAPEAYQRYKDSLQKGTAKVNAKAVYPYQVIENIFRDPIVGKAQWEALPDYMNNENVLPVVDVSGSMHCGVGSTTALNISVSLGLYAADKAKGAFKDVFCSFSEKPKLSVLKGDIVAKITQLHRSEWGMSTNLEAVFKLILNHAVKNKVPHSDMPTKILIISDMQFNSCITNSSDSALSMIRRMYKEAGYEAPGVVFWNLVGYGNAPASHDERGVNLISGFSPAILKHILTGKPIATPAELCYETIRSERYSL